MSKINRIPFIFNHKVTIPEDSTADIWGYWKELSNWGAWDCSLSGVQADEDGLGLGKCFQIIPKSGIGPIPVCVTAFIDGLHFTTSSVSPIGLMSFGHTLTLATSSSPAMLEHCLCAQPSDAEFFKSQIWEHLKRDIRISVDTLAGLVETEVER